MRKGVYALVCVLAAPLVAFGHAEIFFPKVFSVSDLPTTGFAVLNPDPVVATVNFYLVDVNGSLVSQPPPRTIPAGGQLAVVGSELFSNASRPGWVYLVTDTEGMQAIWLNYDGGVTSLDGAPASQYEDLGADQILPLIAGQTELNIINPNFIRIPLVIRLFGANGELASGVNRTLAIAGAIQSDIASLFPAVDLTQARYLRIQTAGAAVTSSVVVRGFLVSKEFGVMNALNTDTRTELRFPHVIDGALGDASYTTTLGVTNLANAQQTITLTFNPDGGNPVTSTRTVPGGGALRETAKSLFGFPGSFQTGWVNVTASAPISGFAAYADQTNGSFTIVPPSNEQRHLFFSHIAEGPPQWQTGIALLNPSDTAAIVEAFALTPSGGLIGTARFTLQPHSKIASVLHQWIPAARGVNGGFVYVRSANNIALDGIELFYTEDLKVLSNVPAAPLVPLVTYTPPAP